MNFFSISSLLFSCFILGFILGDYRGKVSNSTEPNLRQQRRQGWRTKEEATGRDIGRVAQRHLAVCRSRCGYKFNGGRWWGNVASVITRWWAKQRRQRDLPCPCSRMSGALPELRVSPAVSACMTAARPTRNGSREWLSDDPCTTPNQGAEEPWENCLPAVCACVVFFSLRLMPPTKGRKIAGELIAIRTHTRAHGRSSLLWHRLTSIQSSYSWHRLYSHVVIWLEIGYIAFCSIKS